ncbi:hypothetical protein [Myceligenerans xiligouense]|uniref:Uncharacterized protein n=1 Tax=Myceligenerans xiligouense TaxID=253184 RepID=A0A3N4YNB2_9MICO|nr:hypothetical protein [Myceligenerans xiligouense]RPF21607.1 hypothetical protein EDD34_2238 [Myceligenerans xiligouense]
MTQQPSIEALVRHFTDLRDGNHFGEVTRGGKEKAFVRAVELLDPPARRVLAEFDAGLLRGTGEITAVGPGRDEHGGLVASWLLTWPEQRATRIAPISLVATFGAGFHHPHLRGATIGEWPLNVATPEHAEELVPTLRAIAASDLHNLVFYRDWRIVPELTATSGRDAGTARRGSDR